MCSWNELSLIRICFNFALAVRRQENLSDSGVLIRMRQRAVYLFTFKCKGRYMVHSQLSQSKRIGPASDSNSSRNHAPARPRCQRTRFFFVRQRISSVLATHSPRCLHAFRKVNFVIFRSAIVAVVAFGSRTRLISFTKIINSLEKSRKRIRKKKNGHKINICRLPAKHFIFPY